MRGAKGWDACHVPRVRVSAGHTVHWRLLWSQCYVPPQSSTENLTSGTVSGDEGFGAHRSRGRCPRDGVSAASMFLLEEGPGGPLQTGTWVLSRRIWPSMDFRFAATAWEGYMVFRGCRGPPSLSQKCTVLSTPDLLPHTVALGRGFES